MPPKQQRPQQSQSRALLAAIVLSGAASLVYQVAWTRRLASVTSVTVTAQAVTLSIFMAGLGLGALWAGRRAPRLGRPLLGYAAVEVLAAALAALSIPVIAWSDSLRTAWASLGGSLHIGLWVQLVALSLFLLIPATLLGASLPFVIEAVDRRGLAPAASARWISLLYGLNTVGAAVGSLAAGFVSVENLGLWRTTLAGAAVAVGAAAIAVLVERRWRASSAAAAPSQAPRSEAEKPAPRFPIPWLVLAAVAGFIGLAAEVVWTRLLMLVVLNTVYAYTQVLASVLIGIGLGGLIAAALIQRAARGKNRVAVLSRMAAGTQVAAAVFVAFVPVATLWLGRDVALQLDLAAGFNLRANLIVAAFLVPPAALVATVLPLLVAIVRERVPGARAFGTLYASNTAGSVLGSLAAGFVLIPALGTSGAVVLLELATLALAFFLLRGVSGTRVFRVGVAVALVPCTVLARSVDLPRAAYEARVDPGTSILEFREGHQSDVMVTEDRAGLRRIWINSVWVAGTGGGHRSLGYLPALFVERPQRALGIALGTGQTFASAFAHGFHELRCVELDRGVIELSKRWFRDANRALFEKPNVFVHEDDGRAFLRATRERFDLIVLEPLQAWTAGTSNLYSREFYAEARAALAPGGVMAQWIPFYGQGIDETRAMIRAAMEVFPEASLWLDDHDGILLLQTGPFRISPEALAERIRARGLAAELALNHHADVHDLLSLFMMGPRKLREWCGSAPLLTDDRPFLEFAAGRQVRENVYRMPELYQAHVALVAAEAEPIAAYLAQATPEAIVIAADAAHVRDAFLSVRQRGAIGPPEKADAYEIALGELKHASALTLSRYRNVIMASGDSLLRARRWADAGEMFQRGFEHDPEFGEAGLNLAVLRIRQGRYAEARTILGRIEHIERLRERIADVQGLLGREERAAHAPGS